MLEAFIDAPLRRRLLSSTGPASKGDRPHHANLVHFSVTSYDPDRTGHPSKGGGA